MKLKSMFRAIRADDISVSDDTVTFPFSSEAPVERWFGTEILSHEKGAMNLDRVQAGAAPFLWNHDPDQPIGMIISAEVKDGRGFATAKYFSTPFAQEKKKQMEEGLRNISFGYSIDEMEQTSRSSDEGPAEYTATKYGVLEISQVSVPADFENVGIGRSEVLEEKEVKIVGETESTSVATRKIEDTIPVRGSDTMDEKELAAKAAAEQRAAEIKVQAVEAERTRAATIAKLGERFGDSELSRQLVEGGKTIDEARAAFLEKVGTKQKPVVENEAMLDLNESEKMRYSLVNAIRAQLSGNWKDAGFERECSGEIAKRMGKETSGFFMPLNVRMDGKRAGSAGSYQAGSNTLGGNLVQTSLLADSFIELLRNKMLVMSLGAKSLTGLVGNVALPKQASSASSYWVAELADVTESEGTFAQVSLSPKTVGARSQMSRQMLIQGTPDIEMLVRNDLAQVIALAIDSAAISGTGSSGQPKGILNQSGIGSVAMGTNGAAFTNIDPMVDLETAVATSNADLGSLAYLTNASQVGKLKKLKTTTGEYLWNGFEAGVAAGVPGEVNGYRVGRSNQVPSNLTKGTSSGVCSAMIFGNFADLIIGQWGPGVEILANPFGAGFNNGGVDLRALASVDVAVRNAVSFAAITDLL